MPVLEIKNLQKSFKSGSGNLILFNDLNFTLDEEDKFLTVLAPFGSGKSTLLKIIAGLESASGGNILFNGKNYSVFDRSIIYIPEQPSSLPWLNVSENIKFADKTSNIPPEKSQIGAILNLIGLEGYENHYPRQESIGFRFRIAIGRALILNPALILIDDSLRLLDSSTKSELHIMLQRISQQTDIRFLMATTDLSEAVSLADRVIVLRRKPTEVAGIFDIEENRDKDRLIDFIRKTVPQNDTDRESINFTI